MTAISEFGGGGEESLWAPLVDVSRLSVPALIEMQEGALALCLQRLLRDLDDPHGVISGFGNAP